MTTLKGFPSCCSAAILFDLGYDDNDFPYSDRKRIEKIIVKKLQNCDPEEQENVVLAITNDQQGHAEAIFRRYGGRVIFRWDDKRLKLWVIQTGTSRFLKAWTKAREDLN